MGILPRVLGGDHGDGGAGKKEKSRAEGNDDGKHIGTRVPFPVKFMPKAEISN